MKIEQCLITTEDELVDRMVDRFLSWRLPKEFGPDAGISFAHRTDYDSPYWPTGTNLFSAVQAREMVRHMLGVQELVNDAQRSPEHTHKRD